LEPVSPRLVSDLVHPSKSGWLSDIQWSPDGGKIIATDYPGGIVQVWDVATRKQLTKIETGKGYRGSAQFLRVTPDWKTLFVSFEKQKTERLERDGKKLIRYDFDGGVRAWDLETGKLKTLFKHNPPRDVHHMTLSPNGKLFTTLDGIPGEYERGYDQAITVWSVDSQQYRSLPKGTGGYEVFSPDGKKIVVNMSDDDGYSTAIKIYNVQTLQELLSIPVASPYSNMHGGVFRRTANC
jgi:WD40 repeat protein